jgi:diguanylate cyclase (GGDEF)-like protein
MTERSASQDVPFMPLLWLFFTAGVLGALSVVLPHDPITRDGVVLGISAVALAISLGLAANRRRGIGRAGVSVLLAFATLMTAAAIWATGGPPNATSALYMWICLYAAYVLPARAALGFAVGCAASYVLVTVIAPPEFPPVAHLMTTIASLVGATLIVSTLHTRLVAVMDKLALAARTDPLTGLANRRHFSDHLEQELERCRRDGRPLALIVCDLDQFKDVNDSHGHMTGDRVLGLVAQVLAEQSRAIDLPARLGGEEFAIVLPDTDLQAGEVAAERLRLEIERRTAVGGPAITLSLGVACTRQVGLAQDALYRAADRALYAAKADGRNCTVSADRVPLSIVA